MVIPKLSTLRGCYGLVGTISQQHHASGLNRVHFNHATWRNLSEIVKYRSGEKWVSRNHGIQQVLQCGTDRSCQKVQKFINPKHLVIASNFCTTTISKQKMKPKEEQQLMDRKDKSFSELTMGEKVKQTSKDVTYTGVILVGVGVTGFMFYMIGKELFSHQSPSGVYGDAVKHLKKCDQIRDAFGGPLKAYGEMTRRGRRRHVSHLEWEDDRGVKHMRMKFYIESPEKKGTVNLEVKQNENKKYEYRYLFVDLEGYPPRTIIVEDNR